MMRSHVLGRLVGKDYSLRVRADTQEDNGLLSVSLGAMVSV